MSKYVDVDSLVVAYSGHTLDDEFSKGVNFVLDKLDSMESADVVTRDCYDRILWENDVMRHQFAEIGKKFGEKMDDVRRVVLCAFCKHKGWIQEPCHGKSIDYCRKLEHPVDLRFWCAMGEREEQDG